MTGLPTDELTPVLEGVRKLVDGRAPDGDSTDATWDRALWRQLQQSGFAHIGIPETAGGPGGPAEFALEITRELAEMRATVPYGDAVGLGAWLAVHGGFPATDGTHIPLIDAARWDDPHRPAGGEWTIRPTPRGWSLDGRIERVPWARAADHLLLVEPKVGVVVRVDADNCVVQHGTNLADEPMDRVVVHAAPAEVTEVDGPALADALLFRGALFRAGALAGVMDQVLSLTLQYVSNRNQFGGPLVRLGAVQQLLAELAAEVLVCDVAVATAASEVSRSESTAIPLALVAAKARTSRTAVRVAAISHQLHGAMGVTREYPLEYYSRRLLAWRDEYGTERFWEQWLGERTAQVPTEDLWSGIVTAGDSWDMPSRASAR